MTYKDPTNPRPQLPPDVDPLAPGANLLPFNWNTEIIVAAVLALMVGIGLIIWGGFTNPQTANNPPAQTTGQGGQLPPRIAR